jgi:Mg2+ and Co2+ transporter CorA
MSRISEDARRRVRAIREEALSRHADRDRAALASLRDEIAELKAMLGAQQDQLAALATVVTSLAASLSGVSPRSETIPSSPRPLLGHKRLVLERIRDLRDQNLSFAQILTLFEREGVPTLSGQGRWSKGTLWNLWKNHHHQLNEPLSD